mmetsp:Transcript_27876/g.63984  ORF Transcript_27876/g.63984 Transcript_27876/m.63984 type:complete len:155 (-) Transcript_27876:624-1088(-)
MHLFIPLFGQEYEPLLARSIYWVEKAVRVHKVHMERGTVGRTRFDAGDVEFLVHWYERDISGGDERRIFRARPNAMSENHTFNSTELRAINIRMQELPMIGGATLDVVQRRQPPRRAAANNHVRMCMHEVRADPPELLWEIPAGDERLILDWCA